MNLFCSVLSSRFLQIICLGILWLLIPGCSQDAEEPNKSEPKEELSGLGLPEGLPIKVLSERIFLREQAGFEGTVLAELKRNDRIFDLEETSDFLTQLQKEGVTYEAPWIKVQTLDGKKGWVFAAEGFFMADAQHPDFFTKKRLEAKFGKNIFQAYQTYQDLKDSIQTTANWLTAFQALQGLQSSLQEEVNQSTNVSSAFWIGELIPEIVVQQEENSSTFDFYIDYRYWYNKAQQTADSMDDAFVDLCIAAFPQDSIEYRFPAWFFQTSANGGHSLLGRGIHLEMFEKIENLFKIAPIFENELSILKNSLLDDIVLLNDTYWEEKGKASNEIQQILEGSFSILSETDRLALQNRLESFEKAEELGILFNFKSGIH